MSGWKIESRELLYDGAHLQVATERVLTPTHAAAREWTVVHRKRAVVIAAQTAAGSFILIKQERIPIQAAIWEMPAGQIDDDTADPTRAGEVALRELGEETGYELVPGGELLLLGRFYSSPGFTDESAALFLAHPVQLSAAGHRHDATESILDCREFTARALRRMIADGEIADANTLAVFARLTALGLLGS